MPICQPPAISSNLAQRTIMPIFPAKAKRKIVKACQRYLVESNRLVPLYYVNRAAYGVMERIICNRLSRVQGVVSIYLSHGLAVGELYPGLSDFDLVVIFDESKIPGFYQELRQRWRKLVQLFPVSDISLFTIEEFDQWQETGGVWWDPREELAHWRLIHGEELRHSAWDTTGEQGALDRLRYSLGHFQNLIQVAIKEERVTPWFAIVARRQLYKSFCGSVLPLDPQYLTIRKQRNRLSAWIEDHGAPGPVKDLVKMYEDRFYSGIVSTLRYSAAALALTNLDKTWSKQTSRSRASFPPKEFSGPGLPSATIADVEKRASALADNLVKIQGEALESIMLSSTGSARGYALFVIIKDGLSPEQVKQFLVDIRAIFRVFDDPWFNEHFPEGIPFICSRRTFRGRLQITGAVLNYFHAHRRVLYGSDLYSRFLETQPDMDANSSREEELVQERLMLSLYLHQAYLGRLKPALYDLVTCYMPRLVLQQRRGLSPATAEEAVFHYAELEPGEKSSIPKSVMDKYGGMDVDELNRSMSDGVFAELWPFLWKEVRRLAP